MALLAAVATALPDFPGNIQSAAAAGTTAEAGYATFARSFDASGLPRLGLAPVRATSALTISGGARVGDTLTASHVTWNFAGVSVRYEWYVGGQRVWTGACYKVQPRDAGKRIYARAVGTLLGHRTGVATSAARKATQAKSAGAMKGFR
ncbi:MAG: hypothetical protein LBR58_03255 [Propionibacteriaceae bacterium]|jgi:hypothetical protein|nr:hypothetical protein [Propionibacteriaceae bacterium]